METSFHSAGKGRFFGKSAKGLKRKEGGIKNGTRETVKKDVGFSR